LAFVKNHCIYHKVLIVWGKIYLISAKRQAVVYVPFRANCTRVACTKHKGPSVVVPNRMQIALVQNVNNPKEVNLLE